MRLRTTWGYGFAAIGLLAIAGRAEAQVATGSTTPGALPGMVVGPGALANPYANPYLNPYLNPYMTQQQGSMSKSSAALYFFSAQQQQGGLLAPRPANSAKSKSNTSATGYRGPKIAEMPNSLMIPGGTAANYFQRAPTPRGSGNRSSFQRYDGHFGNNGR